MNKSSEEETDMLEEKEEEQEIEEHKVKSLKSRVKKKQKEIKQLKNELEEYKDKYLRLAADMDNLRKRVEREKDEFYKYSLSGVLKELLAILDNFERALESKTQENDENFREGMKFIHKQYLDLLKKNGVKPIEIKDKQFDPNLHQAFMTEESEEVEEPEVGEEFQKGYVLHDRLLRPALVKVIVPKKEK